MAVVRWDPFSEMMTMQRDMNRLFSSLGMPLYQSKGDGERVAWMPTVDVLRKGEDLVVRAELPGVKPDDVDVSITDDVLTIRGERREETEHREGNYLRKESSFGTFERQIMMPQGVDASHIAAQYADGILTVTVPQAAREVEPRTQRIPIAGTTGGRVGQQTQLQTEQSQKRDTPAPTQQQGGGRF